MLKGRMLAPCPWGSGLLFFAARWGTVERFLADLEQQEEMPAEFRERLWMNLVDHVTVFGKDDVRFTFKDGTEIRV